MESTINSTAQACLYPELNADIGTEPPDAQRNASYQHQLNQRLHLFFDTLARAPPTTAGDDDGIESLPTRVSMTLLYCEQTAKFGADFRTNEAELQQNLDVILGPRVVGWLTDENGGAVALIAAVLAWYKERVTVARWRRQAGATLGLARFAVLCYPADSERLLLDDALFLLAAGTLTIEHFEHAYKELALDMFLVILRNLPASDVHATNLADPIFQHALHHVPILKSLPHSRLLWQCLDLCLRHKQGLTQNDDATVTPPPPSQWNCRDDVCLALLTRLAFESDFAVRQFLVECIPSVFVPSGGNTTAAIREADVLRVACARAGICWIACRWTGKLAKILCYHLSCCFGPAVEVLHSLRTVHRAYLVTLFAMPVRLCAGALRELLDEMPTHVLQLLRHSAGKEAPALERAAIRAEVRAILVSLVEHVRRTDEEMGAANGARDQQAGDEDACRFFGGRAETLDAVLVKMAAQQCS